MRGMGEEYLMVLSCSGNVQIFPKDRGLDDLQMDIEVENEYLGLVDGWVPDNVFRYRDVYKRQL